MTDNEKVPYLQCLYHTGKKVYKYWVAVLVVIGVIIGLGLLVATAWKQIENGGLTAISNALGYVGSIIISLFSNAWSLACGIPWYWWVLIGVTIGPLILVAVWCALRHFNVGNGTIVVVTVTIASLFGICNFVSALINMRLNTLDIIIGFFSMFWIMVVFVCLADDNDGCLI